MIGTILKHILLMLLWIYKVLISPMIHLLFPNQGCIHYPSCSENMKIQIDQHGVRRGVLLGLLQLKSCHPFFKQHKQ